MWARDRLSLKQTQRELREIKQRLFEIRLYGLVVLLIFLMGSCVVLAGERTISGEARVIDGDTIIVTAERLRLLGFDAPESDQSCLSAAGIAWPCGQKATNYLKALLSSVDNQVACETYGQDRYSRTLARCRVGEHFIGNWMVRSGHAFVWPRGEPFYLADQKEAERSGRGLWSGQFDFPWNWRRR